jgi:hypothetical protein
LRFPSANPQGKESGFTVIGGVSRYNNRVNFRRLAEPSPVGPRQFSVTYKGRRGELVGICSIESVFKKHVKFEKKPLKMRHFTAGSGKKVVDRSHANVFTMINSSNSVQLCLKIRQKSRLS